MNKVMIFEGTKVSTEQSIVDILQGKVDSGDVDAMISFGLYYIYGIGVERSKRKAAELLERAYLTAGNLDVDVQYKIERIARQAVRRAILDSDEFPTLKRAIQDIGKICTDADELLSGALTL